MNPPESLADKPLGLSTASHNKLSAIDAARIFDSRVWLNLYYTNQRFVISQP